MSAYSQKRTFAMPVAGAVHRISSGLHTGLRVGVYDSDLAQNNSAYLVGLAEEMPNDGGSRPTLAK